MLGGYAFWSSARRRGTPIIRSEAGIAVPDQRVGGGPSRTTTTEADRIVRAGVHRRSDVERRALAGVQRHPEGDAVHVDAEPAQPGNAVADGNRVLSVVDVGHRHCVPLIA